MMIDRLLVELRKKASTKLGAIQAYVVLTARSGRAKQAKGEVRPHCGKTSEIRTSGVCIAVKPTILAQRTLSLHYPTFQRDQSRANLPSIRGRGPPVWEVSCSAQ